MIKKSFIFMVVCLFALSGIALAGGFGGSNFRGVNGTSFSGTSFSQWYPPSLPAPAGTSLRSQKSGIPNFSGNGPIRPLNGNGFMAQLSECTPYEVIGTIDAIEDSRMVIVTVVEEVTEEVYTVMVAATECLEELGISLAVGDGINIEVCNIATPNKEILKAVSVNGIVLIDTATGERSCIPPSPPIKTGERSWILPQQIQKPSWGRK